jgi:hypothetical protein
MPTFSRQTTKRSALTLLVFFVTACISVLQAQSQAPLSIVGPNEVRLGGYANYSALVNGANASVVWSVDGFAGGKVSYGKISSSGMYAPGNAIYAGHSVMIGAATVSTPVSSASLSVKVLNQLPILTSGSITQTVPGTTFLLDVHGSNFLATSQLLLAGTDVATIFISTTELQSTISLPAGTATVSVGVLNPNAEQKSPVSRTLLVQPDAGIPTLTLNPISVAFGDVTLGTASTQTVTLVSVGTAPVTVNSGTLSGTGFTMSGATFPVTLNPALAITLDVRFDPTTAGAVTGQLTIQSNSSMNSTAVSSLSGTGIAHRVNLSWQAPSSSPIPVVGYNIYRTTGGSAYVRLNSSVDTQTTYVDSAVQSGSTYGYIVESVASSGVESIASNEVAAAIP